MNSAIPRQCPNSVEAMGALLRLDDQQSIHHWDLVVESLGKSPLQPWIKIQQLAAYHRYDGTSGKWKYL